MQIGKTTRFAASAAVMLLACTTIASAGTFSDYLDSSSDKMDFVSSTNADTFLAEPDIATGITPAPEPSSLLLLGTGIAGVAGLIRRRRKSETGAETK